MTKKRKSNKARHHRKRRNSPRGYALTKFNPARMKHHRRRRNAAGEMKSGLAGYVTNAVFVIVGALASKLGAQMVLGSNNTGVIGYIGNAAVGAALWLLTEHVMHNRQASSGVLAGTLVQLILRAINDFTPFGSYVSGLGFGDYQMQSFVTPQVLVDPWNSSQVLIPNGWGQPPTPVALPAAATAGAPAGAPAGVGDMYGATYSTRFGGLY